jgi:DNA-binding NarL/FixJ family response regulator
VRNYVSSVLSKLNLSTRAEAAAYAVRHHIENHIVEE